MEYEIVSIIVPDYNSFIEYISKNKENWTSIKKLENEQIKIKLRQRKETGVKNFRPYKNINSVFNDYYFGKGIKHGLNPDSSFKKGDIVTTNCGWDLGIVSKDCEDIYPKVYSRYNKYSGDKPNFFGGNILWHKTGVNVSLEKWKDTCKLYW